MKPAFLRWFLVILFSVFSVGAGTWSDHFTTQTLAMEWTGNRDDFQIVNRELKGNSAYPLTPSPFNLVEIQTDTTDCSVGVWINVVEPNTRVCTKGALVLRHGYVFALHEATQTAEVYRLTNHEMLLNKTWKIDLRKWYYLRAELRGPTMTFFIDGESVGSVTDSESTSGAVGLAVQDAEIALFDDFTVSGPNVAGNVDDLPKPELTSIETSAERVTFRFLATPPYDYFVQSSATAGRANDWQTITNFLSKIEPFEAVVTDPAATGPRFYRIEKVFCNCR